MWRSINLKTLAAVLSIGLASCEGASELPPAPPPVLAPPPIPPPVAGPANYDVDPCLVQLIRPGQTVASLVIPDTLTIDFGQPSRFPNGRALPDPVIDIILAMLFIDLTKHPITTFASVPVNPPANDRPFRAEFPYLAAPQGTPPLDPGTGTNFNFRTDAASAYVRVDRTGFPALATALVRGPQRNAFNDDSNPDDLTFKWVPELRATLKALTSALGDDIHGLGIGLCAKVI
ncbi:MAG: DUF4331 domain-containing protein [Pseudomonadota bacterium]|nr:DUF4331 domain-containing protein [Pseudomonadota bacterium]